VVQPAEDAIKREANNARLHAGETQSTGMIDRLFPENAPSIAPSPKEVSSDVDVEQREQDHAGGNGPRRDEGPRDAIGRRR
jgi:hypothetical protein